MPLNDNMRLNRHARERIRQLLRSFYDRLLAEPVPNRVLVTIKGDELATHAAGPRASKNADSHSS